MRVSEPFAELMSYAMDKSIFDLASLPVEVQGHVPYVVILIQAAESWKKGHEGKLPQNFNEKKEFKDAVKGMAQEYGK